MYFLRKSALKLSVQKLKHFKCRFTLTVVMYTIAAKINQMNKKAKMNF